MKTHTRLLRLACRALRFSAGVLARLAERNDPDAGNRRLELRTVEGRASGAESACGMATASDDAGPAWALDLREVVAVSPSGLLVFRNGVQVDAGPAAAPAIVEALRRLYVNPSRGRP